MTKNNVDFLYEIETVGFAAFSGIVPEELLRRVRIDVPKREEICRQWQKKNGVESGTEGAAHHIVGGGDSLEEFLSALYLDEYIKSYFEGEYILNSFGALNNLPYSEDTYAHGQRFHRDVRTFSPNFRLMLNMIVMVHDFSVHNGATKLIPGSHRIEARPSDEYLEANAVRAVGSAGTIILFNSNLWHSAAPNTTNMPRMALTLTFTRPFFKQQMDYPRMLGEDFPKNERMRQVLGYNSRIPCSYDEWYQPPERRMYKPGQG